MVTYDETKRLRNLALHGFDFVGAATLFKGNTLTREDAREGYGEVRLQTMGLWRDVVVFVVHTPRGADDHIISIRKAERHEQRRYWQEFPPQGNQPDRLGAGSQAEGRRHRA